MISYTIEKLSETCKDDKCFNQCSDVLCMGLCEHLYSCDCDDPANLCKHIHKLHSNLVSKNMHVNTDTQIINEIDMADGFECFAPSNNIKKAENQEKKLEENISKHVALMENPTVKSLRLASVNSILDDLNRQCEAVLTLDNTSLPGQQPNKVKIIPPNKKMDFQWRPQKMRKTKKKQKKEQNLMTHPTLEEKTKIKEQLVASSHIENDIADNPRIQNYSSQETCPENPEPPEKKKCGEEEEKTISIFTNISEIPLREVILRNGCHGLSPLDIKSLDTNVNNNEKSQFQRHYKSYQVGWLHDEVINSFTLRLTKDFTDTIYCASSEALLIAYGKSFGRLWKNINLSIVKKIFIPFNPNNLHWVLIYINIETERSYLIDPMNERSFKITFGVNVTDAPLTFS